MGEVYRARDTRLGRNVAVKVLAARLSDDPEAKQRLDREAHAISSLSHPNICALYDVGHHEGGDYLVMEFLEGQTLADRLRRGPIPIQQILKVGMEICDGLEQAHRNGVVHRDLKPANIMLTKSGTKLMDFGLAKSDPVAAPATSSLTASLNTAGSREPLTQRGTVVGTFQYMSPEQLEGKEADARSDIFALGAVLYEACTGRRAFEGKTTASTIAAILAAESPAMSSIQPMTPPVLDSVVRTCLSKDADDRFQNAHDLKLQLKWIAEGGSQFGTPSPVIARRRQRQHLWIAAATVLALLAIGGIASAVFYSRKADHLRRVVWAQIGPPDHYSFGQAAAINHNVISPDGRMIAFIAQGEGKQLLWVRRLNDARATPLSGTDGAYYPFWSPDSRFIGFFANGKMKKVDANGGVVQNICDAPFGRGGTWNREGVILFAPGIHDVIYRVSDGGGQAKPVTKINTPGVFAGGRWPYFLPDGRHFLYVAHEGNEQKAKVMAASLDSSDTHVVLDESTNVEYANGNLFFVKDGNLVAQSFDLRGQRLKENPVPVASGVEYFLPKSLGNFSVSENGPLVYRAAYQSPSKFAWLDRSGKQLGSVGELGVYFVGRLSPDGHTVAISRPDPVDKTTVDLWLMDTARGTLSRFTFHPLAFYSAAWSPDGRQLAIGGASMKVQVTAANGSGNTRTMTSTELGGTVADWSPNGETLLLNLQNSDTGWDISTLAASGGEPALFIHSPFDELTPRFSPDGHWLAYMSNESGRQEVYVVPFPGPGGRWQVSTGASYPGGSASSLAWSRDSKELYYRATDGTLMATDVHVHSNDFHAEPPRQILATSIEWIDTAPDGRILVRLPAEQEIAPPMTVVLNWDEELREIAFQRSLQ
jgi:Tol biopolymer transport system component